ncbi:MAG: CHASE2 domain-containing protein, partial [Actinobacteria bacterium]|nr:CHASE2 domain-containing protein [Actinomycetota bacterium]
LPPPVFPADSEVHLTTRLTSAFGYTANLPVLQGAAMSGGFFSIPTVDADAVYRRFPLLTNYENGLYESLSLAVARNYLGL